MESFNRSHGKPSIWKVVRGFKREINLAAKKMDEMLSDSCEDPNPGRNTQVARLHMGRKKAMSSYKQERSKLLQYYVQACLVVVGKKILFDG